MNIFFHELKAYRKSTIIWTFSLIMVALLFLSMFPSFAKDAGEFKKLLAGYPLAMRKAIGLNLKNIFTILGFYSYALTFITLVRPSRRRDYCKGGARQNIRVLIREARFKNKGYYRKIAGSLVQYNGF